MLSRASSAVRSQCTIRTRTAIRSFSLTVASALLALSAAAFAQEQNTGNERQGATTALLEEVIVTARKREEESQDVPIAISAYTGSQIEALKIRDLKGLSVAMPNVAMDDIATSRGVANFSIRGLGINSSIPGIDPTVGVFIDGVYMAQNAGVVLDMFDVASIEVLRGPQGTLFGRNVTGGAVLVNTRRPGDELEVMLRAAIDGNPNGDGGTNYYLMGSVGGPVTENFGARLGVYYNEDDGWFENLATGRNHGKQSTTIVRPSIVWDITDSASFDLRWEHLESDGHGPSSQSHPNGLGIPGTFVQSFYPNAFERDSFDMAIDEEGDVDIEKDTVSARLDWDIGPGTLTNIFGWVDYYGTTYGDIDAQPVWLFHAASINDSKQWSNELRYNMTYGANDSNLTMGMYYLDNEIKYTEHRDLLGIATVGTPLEGSPALTQSGGGILALESLAFFAAVDHVLNEDWSLNAGIRYTDEEKDAQIATLTRNVNAPCSITPSPNYPRICDFDFVDSDSWSDWSGKLGFTYHISNDKRVYGSWTLGQRSGGYNLRNTAIDTVNFGPGPFDTEEVTTWEVGYKSELAGGRGRFNAAVFFTQVDDMQREVNQSDPFAGVVQIIKNTANAEIPGFELDGVWALGENTALLASLGWVDPEYTTVLFDLNGDGVINEADKALKLPRAAEWTFSIGLNQDWFLSGGQLLSGRINYAYRDDSYYTDNNLGYLLDQEILDAGLDYTTASGEWTFSIYGRNLLDSVNHGGDTQLPSVLGPVPTGGTFSPLVKGRIVGFEVTFNLGQ